MGAAAEQSKLKGIHVLVVEDSPIQLTMLVRFLRKEGMTTDTATNGAEALALLEQRLPDIIISDVRMPEMDGFSLCANVKRDERLRGVPLILLTTLSEPEDLVRGLAAGADSYALKPYDEEDLLERIGHLLQHPEEDLSAKLLEKTPISFHGQIFEVYTDISRALHFLVTTYENTIRQNKALQEAEIELKENAFRLKVQNRELAKGEQRFRSLIDMVPDIIYRLDKEGNILYLNKAISQLGYRQDELIGVHIEQLLEFDEAWRAETGDEADAARAGEREVRLLEKRRSEERIATIEPLGDEWLEWKDATGRRYRIPGSAAVRDVTSSKRMAHELQRTESSLAAAQRIAHLGEWHWDIASDSVNYSEELYNIR